MMDKVAHVFIAVFDDTFTGLFIPAAKTSDTWSYGTIIRDHCCILILIGYFLPFFFTKIMYYKFHGLKAVASTTAGRATASSASSATAGVASTTAIA